MYQEKVTYLFILLVTLEHAFPILHVKLNMKENDNSFCLILQSTAISIVA